MVYNGSSQQGRKGDTARRFIQSATSSDQRIRDPDPVKRSKTTVANDGPLKTINGDTGEVQETIRTVPEIKLVAPTGKATSNNVVHTERKIVHRSKSNNTKKNVATPIQFVDIPEITSSHQSLEDLQEESSVEVLPKTGSPYLVKPSNTSGDIKLCPSDPDILADTGWDTDLEDDSSLSTNCNHALSVYKESCKKMGVIPASYFMRNIDEASQVLDMKHHGLGPNGIRPMSVALVSNTNIVTLNLSDNWLGIEGGTYISDMLLENCYVTELDLSDNKLEDIFAQQFKRVLQVNTTLTHVTLAGNNLDDKAAVFLAEGIANNDILKYCNLSRNRFGEGAGLLFGAALAENVSLIHFDLSWNAVRRRGAQGIALAIKQNSFLEHLDLSWNGFGNEGAAALGETLKGNDSLLYLDVSNNRILTEGAVLLGKGLSVNETLETLKIGKNPMQSPGCYAVVAAIIKNPKTAVTRLDFSDIIVNNDFWELYNKLKDQSPNMKLRHGGDYAALKPKARVHPMARLKHYIDKQNIRLVDFFNRFDKDGSMSVTREEFAAGIEIFCQEVGIKLTEEEITSLLDDLDKDGDGEINYSELVMGHQDFSQNDKRQSMTLSA